MNDNINYAYLLATRYEITHPELDWTTRNLKAIETVRWLNSNGYPVNKYTFPKYIQMGMC